jgi:hypothetical protein
MKNACSTLLIRPVQIIADLKGHFHFNYQENYASGECNGL